MYTTVGKETIEYIALYKLNLTDEALFNGFSRMLPDGANASTILEELEVYKDVAAKFNTTVGQIMGFNPSYNHSAGGGPTLTIPMILSTARGQLHDHHVKILILTVVNSNLLVVALVDQVECNFKSQEIKVHSGHAKIPGTPDPNTSISHACMGIRNLKWECKRRYCLWNSNSQPL